MGFCIARSLKLSLARRVLLNVDRRAWSRTGIVTLIWAILAPGVVIVPAANRAATAPSSQAATRPSQNDLQRLAQLTRRGIDLLKQKKLDEAEKTLAEALQLGPNRYLALYNMACVKALRGEDAEAMDCLERAAANGFTDFIHIQKDPDLLSLRSLPRYQALLKRKEELQRRDADHIVAFLKQELGQGYLFEIDPEDRLIFATNTDDQTLAALKKWVVMQANSLNEQLFENRPDQYISIIVPSAADYRQIVSRRGVGGFYDHDNRRLIARRLGQVMTHEFTHAMHNADLDPLGQEHPTWLSEGLATLFESGRFVGQALVPADSFRLNALQAAAKRGRLIPLRRLFEMDQKAFTANAVVDLTYGESGSLLLYLYEQGLLRKFYEAYKSRYDVDKTGPVALEQVTGKKLADVEVEWKAWMLKRTPPPLSTGPQGAVLGVRFGDANDGLKVEEIPRGSPAQQAGVKVGDVVVGVDEAEVRDYNSLIPLLATYHPGDTITLKVRRGDRYMSIPLTLSRRDKIDR